MAGIRYPRPLAPGDVVGVTAPSSGVPEGMRDRLDAAIATIEERGYRVELGRLLMGEGVTTGPAAARAAELNGMMRDPRIRAVIPPWGGELAVDLLDRLDWEGFAAAPTWLVGYSDISTLLTPLTLRTGVATLHGANLMDTPYEQPAEFVDWMSVASQPGGAIITQRPASRRREGGWGVWGTEPLTSDERYTAPTRWRRLHGDAPVTASGRLIGGCLETVSMLPGTPYGDIARFAATHAPEGLIVYLEVAEADAFSAARMFHHLRLAGWFDRANAVLIGRTPAADSTGMTQAEAVADALGSLAVPVLVDVDTGHQPPQMPLVNGALATVSWSTDAAELSQRLVP